MRIILFPFVLRSVRPTRCTRSTEPRHWGTKCFLPMLLFLLLVLTVFFIPAKALLPIVRWTATTANKCCRIRSVLQLGLSKSSKIPQGCAAHPAQKKKIAMLGCGGYLGAVTFGFLQRAMSLYGTGIGNIRCIGSTSDTAIRLNTILGRHFGLAQADESFIKLTDILSVEQLQKRLQGWEAIIIGADIVVQRRPVTGGTYEKHPNDKTWELYWDRPRGSFTQDRMTESEQVECEEIKSTILQNILKAAQLTGTVQHLVVVDKNGSIIPQLQASGLYYTLITCTAPFIDTPNFDFRRGVVSNLSIAALHDDLDVTSSQRKQQMEPVCREDLAALCVQTLQTLRWDMSRHLVLTCQDPTACHISNGKRIDQQWCVNSYVLESKLANID